MHGCLSCLLLLCDELCVCSLQRDDDYGSGIPVGCCDINLSLYIELVKHASCGLLCSTLSPLFVYCRLSCLEVCQDHLERKESKDQLWVLLQSPLNLA